MVKIVPQKDWEILMKYLCGNGISYGLGTVLIREDIAKHKNIKEGEEIDYDFGGQCDVMVDIVSRDDHYLFTSQEDLDDME